MWLRNMLDAEAETRNMPRAIIDWRDLFGDRSSVLGRIGELMDLPKWGEGAFAEIDEFLSKDLRHHSLDESALQADPRVSNLVRAVYASLLELVEDPSSVKAMGALDQARAEFARAANVFEGLIEDQEREVRQAQSELQELRAEKSTLAFEHTTRLAAQREEFGRRLTEQKEYVVTIEVRQAELSTQLRDALDESRSLAARLDKSTAGCKRLADVVEHLANRRPARERFAKIIGRTVSLMRRGARRYGSTWKQTEAIRGSVYFDEAYYLEHYPDVLAARVDPSLHYLLHGAAERRDPSAIFSTNAYLVRYPDVARAGMNALLHFETCGRREGRRVPVPWE